MASCFRNCEECEYGETCNQSLTVEAIERRVKGKIDFTKIHDGKGKEISQGINIKEQIKNNRNLMKNGRN